MRYVLMSVLLMSCSGEAFTGTPPTDTGGTGGIESSGGAATGGTVPTGGAGGTGGSLRDASVDGPESAFPDASADASADAPQEAPASYTSCPPSEPSPESSCSGTFDCSYTLDPRASCRPVHQCRNGAWLVSTKQCPPVKYCAALPVTPVSGSPCATKDEFCTITGGDNCSCVQGATLTWKCAAKPTPPCAPRPENKGQPCDDAGTDRCTYGTCGSPDHVQTTCKAGVWAWSTPMCG